MPIQQQTNNGVYPTVSATPIRFGTLTFVGGQTLNSLQLISDGLPGLRVWVLQTLGPGVITVQPQFANENNIGGIVWRPLVPPYAVALNVPALNVFTLGSRRYRIQVTSTGNATVLYRIAGTLT